MLIFKDVGDLSPDDTILWVSGVFANQKLKEVADSKLGLALVNDFSDLHVKLVLPSMVLFVQRVHWFEELAIQVQIFMHDTAEAFTFDEFPQVSHDLAIADVEKFDADSLP